MVQAGDFLYPRYWAQSCDISFPEQYWNVTLNNVGESFRNFLREENGL